MAFSPNKPFNTLPPLPPRADIETRAALRKAISAGRALAELKGLGETIPNQSVLVNSIVMQEAKASSEIENIITTHDALFRAFSAKTGQIDPATKEVLRYREALWDGFKGLRDRPFLTTNLFIRIVQTIRANQAGIRNTPGTQIVNAATGEVVFTPPEGEDIIRKKLKNLEEYIHAEDAVDPLIKLALIHYQFETIHPFTDGNGRTYLPDFIVLVDDGHEDPLHLIVEIKGYRREDAKEKKATMETYWVPGVNNLGRYGRWAFAEFTEVYQIEADFKEKVASQFNQMLERVASDKI